MGLHFMAAAVQPAQSGSSLGRTKATLQRTGATLPAFRAPIAASGELCAKSCKVVDPLLLVVFHPYVHSIWGWCKL